MRTCTLWIIILKYTVLPWRRRWPRRQFRRKIFLCPFYEWFHRFAHSFSGQNGELSAGVGVHRAHHVGVLKMRKMEMQRENGLLALFNELRSCWWSWSWSSWWSFKFSSFFFYAIVPARRGVKQLLTKRARFSSRTYFYFYFKESVELRAVVDYLIIKSLLVSDRVN